MIIDSAQISNLKTQVCILFVLVNCGEEYFLVYCYHFCFVVVVVLDSCLFCVINIVV